MQFGSVTSCLKYFLIQKLLTSWHELFYLDLTGTNAVDDHIKHNTEVAGAWKVQHDSRALVFRVIRGSKPG